MGVLAKIGMSNEAGALLGGCTVVEVTGCDLYCFYSFWKSVSDDLELVVFSQN